MWSDECQEAYDFLKKALMADPILRFPDFAVPFTLSTDASSKGIAYILEQEYSQGIRKPVCYEGRTLKGAEANYSAIELECLAEVAGVQYYHHYLSSGVPFVLQTENKTCLRINLQGTPS